MSSTLNTAPALEGGKRTGREVAYAGVPTRSLELREIDSSCEDDRRRYFKLGAAWITAARHHATGRANGRMLIGCDECDTAGRFAIGFAQYQFAATMNDVGSEKTAHVSVSLPFSPGGIH